MNDANLNLLSDQQLEAMLERSFLLETPQNQALRSAVFGEKSRRRILAAARLQPVGLEHATCQ